MRNRLQNKRFATLLGDLILSVLSIGGVISIVLVIMGLSMNVSIMMFRTGSMEPTIPTGAIALVQEVPATEIATGDVVTVDRGEDLLPVTHRVTEIQEMDEATGAVTFVMRGDANEYDDPEPYTAATVDRAFFSIPGVAPVIQQFQNPYVLGGLTLGAAALVVWAFWPRSTRTQGAGQHTSNTHDAPPSNGVAVDEPVQHQSRVPNIPLLSPFNVKQQEKRRASTHTYSGTHG